MAIAEREVRAAKRQLLFRSVNDRIKELSDRVLPTVAETDFACECAKTSCTDVISITTEEFTAIENVGNRFIVKPGHELLEVEDVVARHSSFLIVAKRGAGGEYVRGHE